GGNVPMIGDADDGAVTRLAQSPDFSTYRSLFASGAILFGSGELKAKAGKLDDKTRWLFGSRAGELFRLVEEPRARAPLRRAFPDGGYYILGCDFETPEEIRLVADAGPLGYRSIAAHGHADALAFTLSLGGLEFLIDPGTYAYHGGGEWRAYFRGTAAHNTLRIDGVDQSQAGGDFMWVKQARARCDRWESSDAATATPSRSSTAGACSRSAAGFPAVTMSGNRRRPSSGVRDSRETRCCGPSSCADRTIRRSRK